MICTSFGCIDRPFNPELLDGLVCAEIRLDLLGLSPDLVRRIFARRQTLIATCRPGVMKDEHRISLLAAAIEAGASYLDLDLDEKPGIFSLLSNLARKRGCRLIVSYHNHQYTPGLAILRKKAADCRRAGADVVKIACLVKEPAEAARIISLYDLYRSRPGSLLAIGMGAAAGWTRIAALLLGAPFIYARPEKGVATAAGQMSAVEVTGILDILDRAEKP